MSEIETLRADFLSKIKDINNKQDLDNIKTELFGKNGKITSLFKNIGKIEADKKKDFASNLNTLKNYLLSEINKISSELEIKEINSKLKNEKIDITLPARNYVEGKIHPVSQVIDELSSIFSCHMVQT